MKNKIVIIALLIGSTVILAGILFAENITLTTYYPAPFGAYDRLRLVPRDSMPNDPHCNDDKDIGVIYYDNGKAKRKMGLYVCHMVASKRFDRARC